MAHTDTAEHTIRVGVTTNLGTPLLFETRSNTSIEALRRQIETQHAAVHAYTRQYGQVTCSIIAVDYNGYKERFALADIQLLSFVEDLQGSSSVGVFAELQQVSTSAAQQCQAELTGIVQPSVQQLPHQHPPSTRVQQPSTAQQVAQTGEQAGAQADENLATITIKAPAVAGQLQKQKRKLKQTAETGGQETGSEAATAKDNNKRKKRKKHKKHSDVAGAVANVLHPSPATPAAMEEMPEAEVPAATQDADQLVAVSSALSDTTDAGVLESGAKDSTVAKSIAPKAAPSAAEDASTAVAGSQPTAPTAADQAGASGPPVKKKRKKQQQSIEAAGEQAAGSGGDGGGGPAMVPGSADQAHAHPAAPGAQQGRREKTTPAESEAEPKAKKKKAKKKESSHVSKGPNNKAVADAQATPVNQSADLPELAAAAQQPQGSMPAQPSGLPPAQPAAEPNSVPVAPTSLPMAEDGDAAAKEAEAGAVPTDTRAQRKKRKRQESGNPGAAREPEPAAASAAQAGSSKKKKKKKSSKGLCGDAAPAPAVTPGPGLASGAGRSNGAALGEADVRAGGSQAGPSSTAANEETAEGTKGDRHTGKPASGGGGAAAADNDKGKGKVEKSKSIKAQLAAEKTAAKGKSVGPVATKPAPAKSQPGQWKTKPTAVVSGVATSKATTVKAGADALALMPHIPTASAMTPKAAAGGGGTGQGHKPGGGSTAQGHNADASTASKQAQGPEQTDNKGKGRADGGLLLAGPLSRSSSSSSSLSSSSSSSSSTSSDSASDEEDVGPTQVNTDTPGHAVTGAPEQPSSSSPDSPAAEKEEEAECTQAGVEDEDAARNQVAPEEAHKHKQAQRPRPPAAKPVSVAAQLAAARAKVQMQERKLQRAKAEQQAAKYGFCIPKGRKGGSSHRSARSEEVLSARRPSPVEVTPSQPTIMVDSSISASAAISEAVSARDVFLQQELGGEHKEVLTSISQCAEDLVASATAKLVRCSTEAVAATMLVTAPHPTCPSSSPSPSPPASQSGAALPVVRQALERALLQSNHDFWVEVIPEIVRKDLKCFKRRRIEAMQFFLRLYILVSCQDDIPLQRLVEYPIIIPIGPFWDELEAWWSDLVNELPEIPFDGNRYFDSHLKPSLDAKIPKAIQMLGRNCGIYTEDDLLLPLRDPDADGGAVVGDNCSPAPCTHAVLPTRGNGDEARAAAAGSSTEQASGTRFPYSELPASAVMLRGSLRAASKPLPRYRREFTKPLGGRRGRQMTWNPNAPLKGKASTAGGRGGRQGQAKKQESPQMKHIRVSDLVVSPSGTEDSDAIPASLPQGQRAVTSGQPKACARHLIFCPIPTIQELEAAEAVDDDAESGFGGQDVTAEVPKAAIEEVLKPVHRGWMQNAVHQVPLGRCGRRQIRSTALAPAGNTRLSLLMRALSPKPLREGQQSVQQPCHTTAVPCSEAACTAAALQVGAKSGGLAQAGVQTDAGRDDALQDRPVAASAPAASLLAPGNCQASTQLHPPASTVQLS